MNLGMVNRSFITLIHIYIPNPHSNIGEYLDKVDRVMTKVDRITEEIAHMPVAAFIFRDKESEEVHYSTDIRYNSFKIKLDLQ